MSWMIVLKTTLLATSSAISKMYLFWRDIKIANMFLIQVSLRSQDRRTNDTQFKNHFFLDRTCSVNSLSKCMFIRTCESVVCSGSERSSSTVSSSSVGGGRGDRIRLTARGFDLTGDIFTTDSSPRSSSQFRRRARSLDISLLNTWRKVALLVDI